MTPEELKTRTKQFGLSVIRFIRTLPRTEEARVIGRQLLRSRTGVGANYRGTCRCKSDPDFISKMGTCIEEADESGYWMELLIEAGIVNGRAAGSLLREADELTRIFVASRATVRARLQARRRNNDRTRNGQRPTI